jgi:hypothetical protein
MDVRNQTPPQISRRYGVATKKVIDWIRSGELVALNLANRNCSRPRYSVTPEALEAFERSRLVVPDAEPTPRLRRQSLQIKRHFR